MNMKINLFLCLNLTIVAESLAASDHEIFKRGVSLTKDIFYLHTRSNSVPDEIPTDKFKDLDKSHFQPKNPSFIMIGVPISEDIRPELLQIKDVNVFHFVYRSILHLGGDPVLKFGPVVANFVNYIGTNYGVPVSNFNFIGYTYGTYIATHAGNLLKGKIATIVGLDPSKFLSVEYPLNLNSSTKMIILHTSLKGVQTNVGNIDIHFNNGRYQPKCGLFEPISCARFRAYEYYCRAILDLGIVATTCDSYENFVGGACDNNQKVSVGSLVLNGTPPGTYYLNYTLQ